MTFGYVEELVAEASGRLAYAVLSFGDAVHAGERLHPVPWSALRFSADERALVLEVAPERLRDAPGFPRESWPDLRDPGWRSTVDRYYYDDEPYLFRRLPAPTSGDPSRTEAATTGGARSRAIWIAAGLLVVVVLLIAAYAAYPWEAEVAANTPGRGAREAAVTLSEPSDDLATTIEATTAIALSRKVSAFDVDVESRDGVVTLDGAVPTDETKATAAAIVRDTAGVQTVENRLTVRPSLQRRPRRGEERWSLADIETRVLVREALQEHPDLARQDLRVAVRDGVVVLTGRVSSDLDRARAEAIARGVPGVRRVQDRLQVAPAG